ncbi:SDR family NAD(P)-dependent oxidoreductase [Conexibacter woesei]|uniref:Short-chain dehydrogenase/reductase SDR n=1 Tax=Conexibacter woesei (strain DSM 14684 / CCUG 47730 / CIP 108061 / JCM 11494 / NBRC 100937 / ID131577) TaxID=469383 RepID=D3F388_CONWI|nr:SDR family NAD(P)-dependent oxidoreductase [Conexibacter woesei]ADB50368.1 short-chain dehydrogenase/reductase SDR [Conexibacter woesei DSM 14684]
MDTGLDGKVALVTGGASGIGLAAARALAAEGCRVMLADLDPRTAAAELERAHPGAVGEVVVDVSAPAQARRAVSAAVERFGRLDVLVTSAGVYETQGVDGLSDEEWDRTLAVNLSGTYHCAHAAIDAMAVNGWGRIVTLASSAAQTGGGAGGPAYVASKAAVMGLTRSLAKHAGPKGVTVNSVVPGLIETPMTDRLRPEHREIAATLTLVGRNGTPADVAAVIVMLASEGLGFVTGSHVNVNGGLVMD